MGALYPAGTPDPGETWRAVLARAGPTGARIASADWASTTLGPLAAWPHTLRTAAGICLSSPFPVVLWWGPDLTMIYNDAYQAILGASKPDALGRPGAAVWPEVWSVLGPELSDVLAGRGATWSSDRPMPLNRDGHLQECFFTVSHTPVVDSAGVRQGVFTTVTETTGAVLHAQRAGTATALAAALVDPAGPEHVGRAAMAVLGRAAPDVTFAELYLSAGDGFALLAATGDPTAPAPQGWPLADVVATRGIRLVETAAVVPLPGAVPAVLVLGLSPDRPFDGTHRAFVELLAGHVATALAGVRAQAAERERTATAQEELRLFKALVERSGDLIAVAGVDGGLRYLNPAGRELTGIGDRDLPAALTDLAAPDVQPGWRDTVIPSVLRDGHHRGEIRLTRRGAGADIDVDLQEFTVAGDSTDTRYLAVVARDITDRQRSVRRAEALARFAGALSTAADRAAVMAAVIEYGPAVFDARTADCAVLADEHDGLDVASARADGAPAWAAVSVDADSALATAVRTNRFVATPADPAAITGCCLVLRYGDGAALGAVEVCWDTAVARDDALVNLLDTVAGLTSQALQRAALSASAAAMATLAARLTVTRSPAEAIAVMVTEVAVALGARLPGLVLREDDGRVQHYNMGLPADLAAGYAELTIDDPRPVVEVLRTGRRIILPDRDAFRERYPDLVDHAGANGIRTTVALPLLDSRGRPVAALGLGWTRRRHFDAADLSRLDTVADLCEQTLERTRLVAAEHQLITRLATRLQAGAVTTPDALDIAVRYRPALTGLNLGGDWHDLIELPGDRLAVVVGDVVGHHVEAAADMAQIRTLINTLIRLGVPLEQVFAQFTALVGRDFWGTAVILVVDPAARQARIARAGHPHPVLLRPGGPVELLSPHRTPPLGLVTGPTVTSTVAFEPGDTLIAYTDGLVERRDQVYDEGVAALHSAIEAGRPAGTASDLADAMLATATTADDDQALVVIRHRRAVPVTLLRADFDAASLSDLRHQVTREAQRSGLDGAPLDDLIIAVYELLSNAVRHGGGRGALTLYRNDTHLVCEIADGGPGFAEPRRMAPPTVPDLTTNGGRGLWLARKLTDTLEIAAGPGGVRVTATVRLPRTAGGLQP